MVLELLAAPFSDGISNLGAWLILINIITFFVENINFTLWLKGKGPYQAHDEYFNAEKDNATMNFMQRNIYILFVLGGALGGLLGYFAIAFRGKRYIKGGALGFAVPAFSAICVVLEWTCIYLVLMNPNIIHNRIWDNPLGVNIRYLLVYFAIINVLAFVLYTKDDEKMNGLNGRILLELVIAFIGGATGGYLSICLEGYFSAQSPLKKAIIKMMQLHGLLLAMLVILTIKEAL